MGYRHYLILNNHTLMFKMALAYPRMSVPYMIYDDPSFKKYISEQELDVEKRKMLDDMFRRASYIIKIIFCD